MESLDDKVEKRCIHQVFRPSDTLSTITEGWGDCSVCTYDEKNVECRGYFPITVTYCHTCKRDY